MYLNICTIGVTLIMYQGIAHSGREVEPTSRRLHLAARKKMRSPGTSIATLRDLTCVRLKKNESEIRLSFCSKVTTLRPQI